MPTIVYLVTDGYAEDNVPGGPFCPCDPIVSQEEFDAFIETLWLVAHGLTEIA